MFIFHCIHTITKPCLKLTCLEEGFACGSKFFSALKIFNPIFFILWLLYILNFMTTFLWSIHVEVHTLEIW